MATQRLNKELKEIIVKKLIAYKFQKQLDLVIELRANTAQKIYEDSFTKKQIALMESLPKGWLPTRGDISARYGGQDCNFNFDGRGLYFACAGGFEYNSKLSSLRLIPTSHRYSGTKLYEARDKMSEKLQEAVDRSEDFVKAVNLMKSKIEVTLNSFTTVGKLKKDWPEVVPFIPSWALDTTETAVAVPVNDLNKKLGLPV